MSDRAIQSSDDWVRHFRGNGLVAMRVPWHVGADLRECEKRAIARSIALFQLGESSEGRHLMRYARRWAERAGDEGYVEAVRMLIAEEQRHAYALARFMDLNGIARLSHGLSDRIFRRMRNLAGSLEISVSVLVTAEIIAKVYYPALGAATDSTVLRTICEVVRRDEIAHVEFQTGQLARIRAGRRAPALWATALAHRILFYPTAVVVGFSHRAALRRAGLRMSSFLSRCRSEFLRDLSEMDPRLRSARPRAQSRSPLGRGGKLPWSIGTPLASGPQGRDNP